MGDHPTAPCRLCGKPIVWATSPDGKRLPLDPRAPVYRVGADLAGTLTGTRDRDALVSHFATCSGIRQGKRP